MSEGGLIELMGSIEYSNQVATCSHPDIKESQPENNKEIENLLSNALQKQEKEVNQSKKTSK